MASICKQIPVDAPADAVWAAVRDFHAVHRRLVPGFVVDVQVEPGARVVTFSNGAVARELLVDRDDAGRRLVYSARSPRVQHHNASVQVAAESGGGSRIVWTSDVLPDELAGYIESQMEAAAGIMRMTLEHAANRRTDSPAREARA